LYSHQISSGNCLVIIGDTKDEMGGSEYYEYIHKFIGGKCPVVNFQESKNNMNAVLDVIQKELLKAAHDCSKGGLAVAVSELCMTHKIGCTVSLDKIPGPKLDVDRILFSESHSRYLLVLEKKNLKKLDDIFKKAKVSYKMIGDFGGENIKFNQNNKPIIDLRVDKAQKTWFNSLRELVVHG
ncbi:MAG: AIR synthase-related protein, partial [Nitrosarchaeum sp.]